MSELRAIEPIDVTGMEPGMVELEKPTYTWVDPRELWVDARYQREMGDKSRRLIRGMVTAWDWAKFTPPKCARDGTRLVVTDGQTTAIGAASNPRIDLIPVQVVNMPELERQADAFVGLNRDRVALTPLQLFRASLLAGNPEAQTVLQVARNAGATILYAQRAPGTWRPGETVAIKAIEGLVNRRFARGARETLEVLAKAGLAPIPAHLIRAVEEVRYGPLWKGEVTDSQVTDVLRRRLTHIDHVANTAKSERRMTSWRAYAEAIVKEVHRERTRPH